MPCWFYDDDELRRSPSSQHGINFETECRYRKEGVQFIIQAGTKMNLLNFTWATGAVYFHRFYMFHSFKDFPRYVTACCCLFLAGKVEETPKKCKDIIKVAKSLLSDDIFLTFGDDPKEEVMTLEKILLQTIKFDLQVEHPYSFLISYAKCFKSDKARLEKMIQMAWTFVNDSLCTTLCLQWEPEIVAVALIYLSCKLNTFDASDWVGRQPKHLQWWDMFLEGVEMNLLEAICHQVLDLYSPANQVKTPNSPPVVPSKEPINEKFVVPKPIETSPLVISVNTPVSTPTKTTSRNNMNSAPTNGRVLEVAETPRTPEMPIMNFTTLPPNFINTTNYPPVFPPVNTSVPPPLIVSPMSHLQQPPPKHHLRSLSTPSQSPSPLLRTQAALSPLPLLRGQANPSPSPLHRSQGTPTPLLRAQAPAPVLPPLIRTHPYKYQTNPSSFQSNPSMTPNLHRPYYPPSS